MIEGLTITEGMTTPSRPGKRPRPVWTVSGNTQGLDEALRAIGGRKWRGAWSFFDDPTSELEQLTEDDRETFGEIREAQADRAAERAERFSGYAANAAKRSEAAFARAHDVIAAIPPGQPILVGHHSEKRHRRDLARSDAAGRKGLEEQAKAEHWEGRAEGAERNSVPDAERPLDFLQRRLEEAEAEQRRAQRELDRLTEGCDERMPFGHRDPREQESQKHWERIHGEAHERAAYWRGLIEARGGAKFGPHNVTKGCVIYLRGRYDKVVRVNRKTVSTESLQVFLPDGRGWPGKITWEAIQEVYPAAKVAEIEAAIEKRQTR